MGSSCGPATSKVVYIDITKASIFFRFTDIVRSANISPRTKAANNLSNSRGNKHVRNEPL